MKSTVSFGTDRAGSSGPSPAVTRAGPERGLGPDIMGIFAQLGKQSRFENYLLFMNIEVKNFYYMCRKKSLHLTLQKASHGNQ